MTFNEAVKQSKWEKAIDDKIAAIERNNIWELVDLPKGKGQLVLNRFTKPNLKRMVKLTSIRDAYS